MSEPIEQLRALMHEYRQMYGAKDWNDTARMVRADIRALLDPYTVHSLEPADHVYRVKDFSA